MKNKIFWLFIFGIAFGYIESSVVVYLRQLYYPGGFHFPVILADPQIAVTEIVRELATLILMYALSRLTFRKKNQRFAAYIIIFGVWDIFYYVFLKIILAWPASIFTWDILFLLPYPWVGPVWAPVLVSLALIWAGILILLREESQQPLKTSKLFWIVEISCGLIIIASFIIPGQVVLANKIPQLYPWYLFFLGFIPGTVFFIRQTKIQGK